MTRTILIIGASRGIGLAATKRALERGFRVRAFARGAERIAISSDALERRAGDARSPADVAAALDGVDAVVQCLGVAADLRTLFGPVRLFSEATGVLIKAMEGAGVRRLVAVTGYGAGDSRASLGCLEGLAFSAILGRAYDDKDVQELLIKRSRLAWTIVRPGVLTNGPATSDYRVLMEAGEWRNGIVSRADVADFVIRALEDERYIGAAPVIIGACAFAINRGLATAARGRA